MGAATFLWARRVPDLKRAAGEQKAGSPPSSASSPSGFRPACSGACRWPIEFRPRGAGDIRSRSPAGVNKAGLRDAEGSGLPQPAASGLPSATTSLSRRDARLGRRRPERDKTRAHRITVYGTMEWYVYIAACDDGSLYTGIATDPWGRLRCHNAGRGSAYVRSRGTATLVYVECCKTKTTALRRELEIKSWRREKKLVFIARSVDARAR